MHHSRLSTLVLDCQSADLKQAADFWSQALGKPIVSYDQDGDGKYAELATLADEPIILLQRVAHESRVHLDIETDDLEAEATRLEQLGAKRLECVHGRWWVMQAPSGHRFCVVKKQREQFGPHLNKWE
ncbi:VOC family protein [Dyella sp. LX-66]|uniref:VOC family protein n=1 Tax=unclassified Dyella TaxID=2634549 RepID=UPI001BDFCF8F|nr:MULTISPECIES: VOC family protein [unclassified Dyella]MBT2117295.1 VOC family protein [Dyella sp. LX-1]MBT2138359.1 VOC family protein [Dyella sp. LX-66]